MIRDDSARINMYNRFERQPHLEEGCWEEGGGDNDLNNSEE